MAVRSLSPSHILLTSGARFRIANVGVADVLEFESRKTLQDLQVEDLVKLGCLVMSLAARRTVGPKSVEAGMNHLGQNFSTELCRAVAALLTGSRSIDQIISQMMPDKICDELDFAMAASDALHLHLRGEYENGRILRLLLKLGIVNERPEFALSPAWSETGDRYVLQLFRDYLFHQTDGDGIPQLDMGHVISSLNKLDIGDPEQILLSSRNGKDMLVVSFSDVRK
ncbi:pan3 [Symbiodinium microadriaticum]|nr:pan3 [Symbiodinium microadriaticum]